jgi:3-phenylpropionate/cinnamic acid dioxygenase small subunit
VILQKNSGLTLRQGGASVSDELVARLDRLESRYQIEALVSNYCHGFDKRDYDRFLSIWWDDCVWKIGPPFGEFVGHDGIHEAIHEVLWPAWAQSQHVTSNLVLEFSGTDSAAGICDVDCMGLLTDSTEATFVGATYRDRYERRDGVWKIALREVQIHYFNQFAGTTLSAPEG